MRKHLPVVVLLFVVVMLAGPVAADDQIAALRQTMTGAAAKMDLATTYKLAAQIVETASKLEPGTLTSTDMFALGLAHYYLAAEALGRAVQTGGLAEADAARAQQLLLQILPPSVEKVRVIGHGERVKLSDYLTPGKTTIVDFFSEYCYPCRQLAPQLEALAKRRDDLMLVKVDLNRPGIAGIDWQSPVARQFDMQSIPHLKIYGPDGKLQAEGDPALRRILQWCQQ